MPIPDLPNPGDLIYWIDGPASPLSAGMVIRQATGAEVADLPVQDPPLAPPLFWCTQFGQVAPQVRPSGEFYSGLAVVVGDWIVGVIKANVDTDAIGGLLT